MTTTVDARGLACPQPVILAKKALEEDTEVVVLVDNDFAVENIRRMAANRACRVSVADKGEGVREMTLTQTEVLSSTPPDDALQDGDGVCAVLSGKKSGPFVVILPDNRMGGGDDILGDILIRGFVHTLLQLDPLPDAIICYNAGVKLAVKHSAVLEDLLQLSRAGADIQVCGTCVNYFGIGNDIAVGRISNMYDIVETMSGAGRLLRP